MVARKIPNILSQCIDEVKAGNLNIMDCPNTYPNLYKQLIPLMTLALQIRKPPDVELPNSLWIWGMTKLFK